MKPSPFALLPKRDTLYDDHIAAPRVSPTLNACVQLFITCQGDDRDVFAVASTITHLPQANAVSDGLTLLPPGLSWLSRALLCSGTALEDLPSGHGLKEEQAREKNRETLYL